MCLRKIKQTFWPNMISNHNLLTSTESVPLSFQLKTKRWGWLAYMDISALAARESGHNPLRKKLCDTG